jgi:Fanconi-associated nuclease 1
METNSNEVDQSHAGADDGDAPPARVPFYLRNLELVVDAIVGAQRNSVLFDESDLSLVNAFRAANENARRLFARLFMRKRGWFRVAKLDYPELGDEIPQLISGVDYTTHVDIDWIGSVPRG